MKHKKITLHSSPNGEYNCHPDYNVWKLRKKVRALLKDQARLDYIEDNCGSVRREIDEQLRVEKALRKRSKNG